MELARYNKFCHIRYHYAEQKYYVKGEVAGCYALFNEYLVVEEVTEP